MQKKPYISMPVIRRLPRYYRFLRHLDKRGVTRISSKELSEKMGVSTSTVSRAAQNKYIQFQGRIIPVRSFFTTAIRPDAAVSSHAVKQRLQSLIRAEDPAAPLSDEALRLALSALGIEVSRRAVAKYRAEMDIPSSSQRKKR